MPLNITSQWDYAKSLFIIFFLFIAVIFGFRIYNAVGTSIECLFTKCKTELIEENKKLEEQVQKQQDIIDNNNVVHEVENKNHGDNIKAVQVVHEKEKKINKTVGAAKKKLDNAYRDAEAEEDPVVKDQKVAKAELDALWDVYCQSPSNNSCGG